MAYAPYASAQSDLSHVSTPLNSKQVRSKYAPYASAHCGLLQAYADADAYADAYARMRMPACVCLHDDCPISLPIALELFFHDCPMPMPICVVLFRPFSLPPGGCLHTYNPVPVPRRHAKAVDQLTYFSLSPI